MSQITSIIIALLAGLSLVSAKCDILKEFKPEYEEIKNWAQTKCGSKDNKIDLTEEDIEKINSCFTEHLSPKLKEIQDKYPTDKCPELVDTFIENKLLNNKYISKYCYDEKVLFDLKKDALKDVGFRCGLTLKRECEDDCPGWKTSVQNFAGCCKEDD